MTGESPVDGDCRTDAIPLSLYIHFPWCVRKCPYCDFNSHAAGRGIPEDTYVRALLADLDADLPLASGRPFRSIFIGGGTPSLLSARACDALLDGIRRRHTLLPDAEITLEANPGTAEQSRFRDYRSTGINRLSIGIQSFNDERLKALGRIHDGQESAKAVRAAVSAGFTRINIDLMHGLPAQTPADALADLRQAIALEPTHLSWYQLTIEPNTAFFRQPPTLPGEDTLDAIETSGLRLLEEAGLRRYEVSAFARDGDESRHNLNYWTFGDYLGIGAGAHGKVTTDAGILRQRKSRLPDDYLASPMQRATDRNPFCCESTTVEPEEIAFEFMLNALRLVDGVDARIFPARTGLSLASVSPVLDRLRRDGLLVRDPARIACTPTGLRFLNDVVNAFR